MTDWTIPKESAIASWQEGDLAESVKHWLAAIKLAEIYGKEDGRFVTCLDGLARAQYAQGDFAKAEKSFKQALSIRDRNLASGHKDIATSANNLAVTLFHLERYEESENYFRKALTIRKQAFGDKSNEVGWIIYQMALVFHAQKKYVQAEDLYKQAMEIKSKILGPDHKELIDLLRNYADLLKKTGMEETAERMEAYAQSIEDKSK